MTDSSSDWSLTGAAIASRAKEVAATLKGLLDYRVGALLKLKRHVEAERLGGLEVDRQLELDRGLDRKLARLLTLEDAIGIARRAPKVIERVISVDSKPPSSV